MAVTLVTGGARSGKSRHAEHLAGAAERLPSAAEPLAGVTAAVTYLATGLPDDGSDAEWSARLSAHRSRRPPSWRSVETLDLEAAVDAAQGPVLVDCLGTWLTGLVDRAALWDDLGAAADLVACRRASLCASLRRASVDIVVVTNEVGLCLVPQTPSGRFFQDQLGLLNAAVSAVADHVHLVLAGRVIDLSAAPVVP